jgi:hypothetical protein
MQCNVGGNQSWQRGTSPLLHKEWVDLDIGHRLCFPYLAYFIHVLGTIIITQIISEMSFIGCHTIAIYPSNSPTKKKHSLNMKLRLTQISESDILNCGHEVDKNSK